ncbi:MAG: hypothetical protein ACTTH7_10070 [Treponema sp.]
MIQEARVQAAFFRWLTVKRQQQHRYRCNRGLHIPNWHASACTATALKQYITQEGA